MVDGQQRSAAIREARVEAFPICVTAFITESAAEQRSQFILVNSTKRCQRASSTNCSLPPSAPCLLRFNCGGSLPLCSSG